MADIDFNQLVSMNSRRLFCIAYSITRDRFLAEDVVQESLIKAYKKIDTVEDSDKISSWLSAIATRTAIDFVRAEKRKNCLPADQSFMEQVHGRTPARFNTEEEVDILLFKEDLNRTIKQLSPEYQEVLILKAEYGLKENEIAGLLQLKSATVKTRLYRARKQLKQAFARESA